MKLTGKNRSTWGKKKTVPVPLCPPQIPHGVGPELNPGLHGDRPMTNRLSHGTASVLSYWKIIRILWNLKVRDHIYKSPPLVCILRHLIVFH
jgi:hypothetical protein